MQYFSLRPPQSAKIPVMYEISISSYYMENSKQNQQFCAVLWTKVAKTAKRVHLEEEISNKSEFPLIIVRFDHEVA
jgi:hypothetical protein